MKAQNCFNVAYKVLGIMRKLKATTREPLLRNKCGVFSNSLLFNIVSLKKPLYRDGSDISSLQIANTEKSTVFYLQLRH